MRLGGGGDFEKGKRDPNEPKVILFTIDTDFLASRFNKRKKSYV